MADTPFMFNPLSVVGQLYAYFLVDEAQGRRFGVLVGALGAPSAAASISAFAVLYAAGWRPSRAPGFKFLSTGCGRESSRRVYCGWAFNVLLATSCGVLIAWGAVTAALVRPRLLGVGTVALLGAAALSVFGVQHARARGWRSFIPSMGFCGRVDPVLVCLTTVAALVTTYELCVIFTATVSMPEAYAAAFTPEGVDMSKLPGAGSLAEESRLYAYAYSYVATSWMFLTWNQLLVLAALYASTARPPILQPRAVMALGLQWRKARLGAPAGGKAKVATATAAASSVGGLARAFLDGRVSADTPVSEDVASDDGVGFVEAPTSESLAQRVCAGCLSIPPSTVYTILSRLVLVAYMVVNWFLASSSVRSGEGGSSSSWDGAEGRYLAFTTSGCVLLIDGSLALMVSVGLLASPGAVGVATTAARIALIAFGARWWLVGISTVYAVLGMYLAHAALVQVFAVNRRLGVLYGGTREPVSTPGTSAKAAVVKPAVSGPIRFAKAVSSVVLSPIGVLLMVTAAFAAFLAGLGWAMNQPRYNGSCEAGAAATCTPSTPVFPNDAVGPLLNGRSIPQFTFAIGALVLVIESFLIEFAYRLYHRGGRAWGAGGWAVALLSCAGIAGSSGGIYYELQSPYILSVGVFMPVIVVVTGAMYGQWVRDDFAAWVGGVSQLSDLTPAWLSRRRDPTGEAGVRLVTGCFRGAANPSAAAAGRVSALVTGCTGGNVFERWHHFWSAATSRNAVMSYGFIFVALCHVGMGVLIGRFATPFWAGLGLAGASFILLCISLAVSQWFNTLAVRPFQYLLALLALVVFVAIHAVVWADMRSTTLAVSGKLSTTDVVGVAFSFVAWPAVVAVGLALYVARDNSWKFTRATGALLISGHAVVTGILAASVAVFEESVQAPAALLALWLVLSGVVGAAVAMARSPLATPKWFRPLAVASVVLLICGGLAFSTWEYAGAKRPDRAALWLSVALWACILLLVVGGLARMRSAGSASTSLEPSLVNSFASARGEVGVPQLLGARATGSSAESAMSAFGRPLGRGARTAFAMSAAQADSSGAGAASFSVTNLALIVDAYKQALAAETSVLTRENDAILNTASTVGSAVLKVSSVGQVSTGGAHKNRLYFSPYLFPLFSFDTRDGLLRPADIGLVLVLTGLLLASVWSLAAIVFVYPAYIGVMVLNLAKLGAALLVTDCLRRGDAEFAQAIALLFRVEPGAAPPPADDASSKGGVSLVSSASLNSAQPGRIRVLDAAADAVILALCQLLSVPEGVKEEGGSVDMSDPLSQSIPAYVLLWHALFPSSALSLRADALARRGATTAWADFRVHAFACCRRSAASTAPAPFPALTTVDRDSAEHVASSANGAVLSNPLHHLAEAGKAGLSTLATSAAHAADSVAHVDVRGMVYAAAKTGQAAGKTIQHAAVSGGNAVTGAVASTVSGLRGLSSSESADEAASPSGKPKADSVQDKLRQQLATTASRADFVAGGACDVDSAQPSDAVSVTISGRVVSASGASRATEAETTPAAALYDECLRLDVRARESALDEAWLLTLMKHHLISAGVAADGVATAQWAGFLAWCAQPRQQGLIKQLATLLGPDSGLDVLGVDASVGNGIGDIALYAAVLVKAGQTGPDPLTALASLPLPTHSSLRNKGTLLAFWLSSLGPSAASSLSRSVDVLQAAYASFVKAVCDEAERKAREDEEADRRRREEEERRRRVEEADHILKLQAVAEAERVRVADEEEARRRAVAAEEAARVAREEVERLRLAAEAAAVRRQEEEADALRRRVTAQLELKRLAEEEEARRLAAEAAEAARRQEEEARRRAEEQERQRSIAAGEESTRAERLRKEEEERGRREVAEATRKAAEEAERLRRVSAAAERARREEEERQRHTAEEDAARARRHAEEQERLRRETDAAARRVVEEDQKRLRLLKEEMERRAREKEDATQRAADEAAETRVEGERRRLAGSRQTDSEHFAALQSKVAALCAATGGGSKWVDPDFNGTTAIGPTDTFKGDNVVWMRAQDGSEKPVEVISSGYAPDDIRQGTLGDCWLLSAFAVVSQYPQYLNSVLVTKEANPAGVYGVRLWKRGKWREVIVDDAFPFLDKAYRRPGETTNWAGAPNPSSNKLGIPAYVRCRTANEMWPMLLEKAFAKYHGSYSSIEGGYIHDALCTFVPGSVGSSIKLKSDKAKADFASGELFTTLRKFVVYGYLLGASSPAGSDKDTSDSGIVQGHAYSLLRVEEVDDVSGTHRLVQLRNPWGSGEWKGAWSDGDKGRWRARIKQKLNYDPDASGDDGAFWMSFADFVQNYDEVNVCRIFRTVGSPEPVGNASVGAGEGGSDAVLADSGAAGGERKRKPIKISGGKRTGAAEEAVVEKVATLPAIWYRYSVESEWKGPTAGGRYGLGTYSGNPQYFLAPTKECNVYVSLSQADDSSSGGRSGNVAIGVQVVSNGGKRAKAVYVSSTPSYKTDFSFYPESGMELKLVPTPAGTPYTLIASTFDAGKEKAFTLTVYADAPLDPKFCVAGPDAGSGKLLQIPTSVPAV